MELKISVPLPPKRNEDQPELASLEDYARNQLAKILASADMFLLFDLATRSLHTMDELPMLVSALDVNYEIKDDTIIIHIILPDNIRVSNTLEKLLEYYNMIIMKILEKWYDTSSFKRE